MQLLFLLVAWLRFWIWKKMGTLTDYFQRIAPKTTWNAGDRVFGRYNGQPVIGTVLREQTLEEDSPMVVVNLDLPVLLNTKPCSYVLIAPKDLKRLKEFK